ncbi:MAG TPA: calcium/sodium antiporter [Spirochaetota bacterium]|nr:calcium/sodium antiporter [Spirochaetota bacterium]HQO00914.1 calcium/sodium antiporter [Spirochaetota bacterium]
MILHTLILIVSIFMLWFGAKYLVESAGRIAESLGISELVIGLTVVAFGTSAPEFAVTVGAALKGQADISVSNIVGSNIFNLGFILGTVAIVRSITSSRKLVYRDGAFMIGVTFLLLFFFRDLHLSRIEGIILCVLLVFYMILLFYKKEVLEEGEFSGEKATWKDYILLPASIAVVVAGGHFLVESASAIATMMGVSPWVIGVTIVAAGTSAPEMATSLAAAIKGKHGMSAGNLIGSDIFNILGVLGIAGILNPMSIPAQGYSSLFMLSGMVILVMFFLRTGWRLSRTEGIILVTIGLVRWIFDFMQ